LRNEDLFFSFACKFLGKLLPKKEERNRFAIENEAAINPSFYHGWNKEYQTEEEAKRLIQNSLITPKK
jgi:hypothetical protein